MKHPRLFQLRPFIIVSASFLAGALIYIFFRDPEPLFFKVFRMAGLDRIIDPVRIHTLKLSSFLPEWFIYSLPDAVWSFAYAFLITLIWWRRKSVFGYLWLASIPAVIAGIEILQIDGTFPGTFTFPDLLFELSGMVLGILTAMNYLKSKYNEKTSTQIDFQT